MDRHMRALSNAACIILVSLTLAGCMDRPDATYRYKLTISIETPEGTKTGSNVVELDYYRTASGAPHRTYGQALVLDLGPRGVLAALLSQKAFLTQSRTSAWVEADPGEIILSKCVGDGARALDRIDMVRQIEGSKDAYSLDPSELPDLIVFRNAKEPSSAAVTNSLDFAATLGAGVRIQSATIQITHDPITRGVDELLPWVRHWTGTIALPPNYWTGSIDNWVGSWDFIKEGQG
jgi:hypothetical protein